MIIVEGAEELRPACEVDEPDKRIEAAAEVVEAIAVAATASGWLWVPSYVVIRIDISLEHLCTWNLSRRNDIRKL